MQPVAVAHSRSEPSAPPWPMYTPLLAQLAQDSGAYRVVWAPDLTPAEQHAHARCQPVRPL